MGLLFWMERLSDYSTPHPHQSVNASYFIHFLFQWQTEITFCGFVSWIFFIVVSGTTASSSSSCCATAMTDACRNYCQKVNEPFLPFSLSLSLLSILLMTLTLARKCFCNCLGGKFNMANAWDLNGNLFIFLSKGEFPNLISKWQFSSCQSCKKCQTFSRTRNQT